MSFSSKLFSKIYLITVNNLGAKPTYFGMVRQWIKSRNRGEFLVGLGCSIIDGPHSVSSIYYYIYRKVVRIWNFGCWVLMEFPSLGWCCLSMAPKVAWVNTYSDFSIYFVSNPLDDLLDIQYQSKISKWLQLTYCSLEVNGYLELTDGGVINGNYLPKWCDVLKLKGHHWVWLVTHTDASKLVCDPQLGRYLPQ